MRLSSSNSDLGGQGQGLVFRVRMCVSSYGTVVFLAVLRYAQTIRILYLQRRYTTLRTKLPPKEARDRFKALVVIQETFYDFELSAAFTQAISDTEAAITAHYALPPTAPNPGAAGPS